MLSVTLHYHCVQKIRCKRFVMSEVKEGNENVNCRRKLLNGTNRLSEVFVYPCAACLPQSIITKDKPPRGNECPRSVGKMEGPALNAQGNSTHAQDCQSKSSDLAAVRGRSRNRQARGLLAFKHCNSANIKVQLSVDGKHP